MTQYLLIKSHLVWSKTVIFWSKFFAISINNCSKIWMNLIPISHNYQSFSMEQMKVSVTHKRQFKLNCNSTISIIVPLMNIKLIVSEFLFSPYPHMPWIDNYSESEHICKEITYLTAFLHAGIVITSCSQEK